VSQVSVTINGRPYLIYCDDGQEANLTRLGAYVDKRVGQLAAALGKKIDEDRLLVMTTLLIADELSDVITELDALKKERTVAGERRKAESDAAQAVEGLAARLEDIAAKLERP
jgi:cell division protein ZapA